MQKKRKSQQKKNEDIDKEMVSTNKQLAWNSYKKFAACEVKKLEKRIS